MKSWEIIKRPFRLMSGLSSACPCCSH